MAGITTSSSSDSCAFSYSDMITPPTAIMGADASTVSAITMNICTCCTSLVLRVISEAAPK